MEDSEFSMHVAITILRFYVVDIQKLVTSPVPFSVTLLFSLYYVK